MSLITLARATELIPNFPSADNSVMQDIVDACSDVIERYTNRTYAVTSYDELYDGAGIPNLLLKNYPVISISRISVVRANALMILNTDLTSVQAEFRLSSTSLVLTSSKNGVTTTRTITLATTPTVGDLATAINTFSADGWSATAITPYAGWATTELRPPQGAWTTRYSAGYLKLYAYSLFDYLQNPDIGEIVSYWNIPRGYQNIRVLYSAGFATVPTPVQQACAELACATYNSRLINPNLQSESLGEYSYTIAAQKSFRSLSITAMNALALYRNYRIPNFRVYQ